MIPLERLYKIHADFHLPTSCFSTRMDEDFGNGDRKDLVCRALQEWTVEEFETQKADLMYLCGRSDIIKSTMSRWISAPNLLQIISARGISWLDRALEVARFDKSELYGLAIATESEHTSEIYATFIRRDPEFKLDDVSVIQAVATCKDCVEKLMRWTPHILEQDFGEKLIMWRMCLEHALNQDATALRDVLYTKVTPGDILDLVFSCPGMFLSLGSGPYDPELLCALDAAKEALSPLVQSGDDRIKKFKADMLRTLATYNREEPDYDVMLRLEYA